MIKTFVACDERFANDITDYYEKNEAIILNLLLEVHDNYWFNDIYILSVTRSITRFYVTMDDDDLK